MDTDYIIIKGYVKDGKLEIDLPENVVDGEIEVKVAVVSEPPSTQNVEDLKSLTKEEIDALMHPNPKTGAEIIALGHTGGWEHLGIEDSVEWVKELRRKRRERRGW